VLGEKKTTGSVWVVLGSAFSLTKDHEAAIKMFRRGVQVAPFKSSIYSMLAYEYVAREKLDKAQDALARALELNPRNYAALWLAGNISINQEEWQAGYSYLGRAVEVNSKHAGLRVSLGQCCVGLGLLGEAKGLYDKMFDGAGAAGGSGVAVIAALYEKAKMDFEGKRFSQAKEALEKAKALAPKEPGIHFLLGRVYAALNEDVAKIMCAFDAALELSRDSKEAAAVKTAIEELGGRVRANVGASIGVPGRRSIPRRISGGPAVNRR
jgi:anaphase-promoting complex subunit 3